jgi:2-C-methyl-D-erythritol 4-phosphate cytidylyltransferase / 2-C-methyl-D-erythritol 2,4-cyclodiphosphate synthase
MVFRACFCKRFAMKTVAIIPAGGSGRRAGASIAKQYLLLHGVPLLARTLRVFQNAEAISAIVLVVPTPDVESVRERIVEKYSLTKVAAVVAGGGERQDSVASGLRAVPPDCDIVMVHDAVRPFVTGEMIDRVAAAAACCGAASLGVPAKDTIKETTDDGIVTRTFPRSRLWQTQTPQAFACDLLRRAHASAKEDHYYGTDDASLVERIGAKVQMIAGSGENMKITTPEDMKMAESLLCAGRGERIRRPSGLGYDSHRFAKDRKLVLGGVDIPFDRGLAGHSDADALLHAVCDALLGMAGEGDIGRHFPDHDPAYKNISSLILLERVGKMVESRGVSIENIDATLVLEKPRLAPYAQAMAANIARVLKIPETAVNIKAKTNEGMGFTGRGEGVAVWAVASGAERIADGE